MECERINELLPWFANGTLEGEERRTVSEHLAGCRSCRRELDETLLAVSIYKQHLPTQTLIDYAFDQPVVTMDRGLIESHLRTCAECSEQLGMVRESRLLEEGEPSRVVPLVSKKRSRTHHGWRYAALAASLIALIGIGGWLLSEQQEEVRLARLSEQQKEMSERLARLEAESRSMEDENRRLKESQSQLQQQKEEADRRVTRLQEQVARLASPQLNAPTLDVYPGELTERAEGRTANDLEIPGSALSVTLILNSHSPTAYTNYSIEILDARNRRVWKGGRLLRQSTNDYTINVPTSLLPPGRYGINIYGQREGKRVKVESYKIRIRRARK
ncbi:MAG: zf-HC2 domain-containing protein [Blastocatellia bacterium]|nr:zf-HC2 domain-containing protein [Blastocatellia bacterium]